MDDEEEEMVELMQQMDAELSLTDVGKSFHHPPPPSHDGRPGGEEEEGSNELEPVDVDLNLVQSLLESYRTEAGEHGPASSILQSLGLHLPSQQKEEGEEEELEKEP